MSSMPEGMRGDGDWVIVGLMPDVCILPSGTPCPFSIVAISVDSVDTSTNVQLTQLKGFHAGSHTFICRNNEPGSAGGIVSSVNVGTCYSLTQSSTVNINNHGAVRDGDFAVMNASSHGAIGNIIGRFTWRKFGISLLLTLDSDLKKLDEILRKADEKIGVPVFTHKNPQWKSWDDVAASGKRMGKGVMEGASGTFSDINSLRLALFGEVHPVFGVAGAAAGAGSYAEDLKKNQPDKALGRAMWDIVLGAIIGKAVKVAKVSIARDANALRTASAPARRAAHNLAMNRARAKAKRIAKRRNKGR